MARLLRTTPRELQGQLIVLAIALWGVALANSATPTRYLRSGQVRGTDFVQFYALGRLAASGQLDRFDDFDAIRRAQLDGVPEATGVYFPPVYGPQVPLLLAPLGRLSYGWALGAWVAASAFVYFVLCRAVIVRAPRLARYKSLALIAAAAFPAFWQLLQHGQLTIVAMAAIVGAWLLLTRGQHVAAGVVLGLMAYKPPLLLPALVVLLLARDWRVFVPAVLAATAEVLVTVPWVGVDGIRRYVLLMLHLPSMATTLFTKPEQAHGLKAFWTILVPVPLLALALYLASAIAVALIATAIGDGSAIRRCAWRR